MRPSFLSPAIRACASACAAVFERPHRSLAVLSPMVVSRLPTPGRTRGRHRSYATDVAALRRERNTLRLRGVELKASTRTMFIQVEDTPNQNALKFKPGVPVMGSGPVLEYMDGRSATTSPLARRLFKIDGVKSILLGPDFVTISKNPDGPWPLMKPEIFASIMDHFASGQPTYIPDAAAAADTAPSEEDDEVVAMIKELLDTRIRPAIQEDGGDVEFKGFDEDSGTVKLKLKGSCRSCSSSTVTLKNGIEQMLMHYVPEVQTVEQVVDELDSIADQEFAKLESKLSTH